MRFEYQGIFGVLVLIADIWAIVSTLASQRSTGTKVAWILLVVLLPFLGWLLWLFLGPRQRRAGVS